MVLGMMFVPSVMAWPPEVWEAGDEVEITGHSFDEEYWTADISNTTEDDAEITVTMSYVNNDDAQAFLLAFKTYEKNGNVSTLPYQLFGMHYTGPGGHDVFIGAVLAFLMAFNDTCNGTVAGHNGMPDPHHAPGECQESVYYVLPFGVGEALENDSYAPTVTAVEAKKLGDGHYRFGMTYENLYAKVIDASNILSLIASAILPIYIAKFSELSVVYEITYNEDNSVTAETYYTLGQVTQLWLWGQETEPTDILVDNWGIAAVHYVATFWSTYKVTGDVDKHVISTGIQKPLEQGLDLAVGTPPRKVFNLGIRGTFDLIDEDSGTKIQNDADAYNMLVNARYEDKWLVAWQGGFSLGFMATMAYAVSPDLQSKYDGPLDLFQNGANSFIASDLWYAVSFPQWNGYRVVHDPVYTAFIGTAEVAGFPMGLALLAGILLIIVIVAVVVAVAVRKSRVP
jgi:hypothetical protein